MNGFELKLWRIGMGWEQERAAEELGVSRRTYQYYEKKGPVQSIYLATFTLSLKAKYKDLHQLDREQILDILKLHIP